MTDPKHQHSLSINSMNSLVEPTTPPSFGSGGLWESYNGRVGGKQGNSGNYGIAGGPLAPAVLPVGPVAANGGNICSGPTLFSARPLNAVLGLEQAGNDKRGVAGVTGDHKLDKEYLASLAKVPLVQIRLEILRLSKDQYGCRFLQKKIDENVTPNRLVREENAKVMFEEVYPYMYELIIDPFGNYLVQKLVEQCDEHSISMILELLQYNLFQISINQHGTRALQKIISCLRNDRQLGILIKGLQSYVIKLIKDLNGNHVIQKILNKYAPEKCQFIYDSILLDLCVVATHKHGCCVLQKCLNHVNSMQLLQFSQKILAYDTFQKLINDQFGNYVLQYLISIDSVPINAAIFDDFLNFGLEDLCSLKFSSNVVEKFLKNCYNKETRDADYGELKFGAILSLFKGDLNKLVNDPFGNYVVQTVIDVLVNPGINYENHEGIKQLLPLNFDVAGVRHQHLQVAIVSKWFTKCQIFTSFGKRIQLKISSLLSNKSSLISSFPNGVGSQSFIPSTSSTAGIPNNELGATYSYLPMGALDIPANQNSNIGTVFPNPHYNNRGSVSNIPMQGAFAQRQPATSSYELGNSVTGDQSSSVSSVPMSLLDSCQTPQVFGLENPLMGQGKYGGDFIIDNSRLRNQISGIENSSMGSLFVPSNIGHFSG